jgi:hypothetical protein
VASRLNAVVTEAGTGTISTGYITGGRGTGCLSTNMVAHFCVAILADSGLIWFRRVVITELDILTFPSGKSLC